LTIAFTAYRLARACGAVGFKAEKPGELRGAIDPALKAKGPAIVDCVVPADELPNVPHIDLEKMENFRRGKDQGSGARILPAGD
jgi:pyruvate dehydrogenase (quinone)